MNKPVEQFQRIKNQPFFWKPLMIVMAITILGLWLTSLGVELPSLEHLTEKEIRAGKIFAYVGIVIIGIVTTAVSILVSTVIFFVFTKIVQSGVTFKQLFTMNTYIMLITGISMVFNGLLIAMLGNYGDNEPLYTSLARYITADGRIGVALNSVELFSIWTLILTAIGLHHVANIPKKLSWAIAVLFFVTGIISGLMGLKG